MHDRKSDGLPTTTSGATRIPDFAACIVLLSLLVPVIGLPARTLTCRVCKRNPHRDAEYDNRSCHTGSCPIRGGAISSAARSGLGTRPTVNSACGYYEGRSGL